MYRKCLYRIQPELDYVKLSNYQAIYFSVKEIVLRNLTRKKLPVKHDVLLIIGDMNAQLGSDTETWKPHLGSHAEGELNDNGLRLLTFCQVHNLVVGSSLFPHKRIHKLTWNSPDGRTVNQIDHTLINCKWRNSLKDVRVFRGADSDHNLASTSIRLSLSACRQQRKQARFDSEKLLNRDTLKSFDTTIGGSFHVLADLDETADIDREWEHFSKLSTMQPQHTLVIERGRKMNGSHLNPVISLPRGKSPGLRMMQTIKILTGAN